MQSSSTDASRPGKTGAAINTLALAGGRGLHLPNLCTVQAVFLLILAVVTAGLMLTLFKLRRIFAAAPLPGTEGDTMMTVMPWVIIAVAVGLYLYARGMQKKGALR